jgi:hypothetical protein
LGAALACGLHLLRHAEKSLDMMADLMSDHIGLGEIACSKLLLPRETWERMLGFCSAMAGPPEMDSQA